MGTEVTAESVERRLESLLEVEKFPPPDDFRSKALVTDESMYEEAERDLEGFWSRQAGELIDWFAEPSETLDESNAPFYKWFADGKLNASYNCLDRHVEAGNGDRVAYHWRGEEGEEREITYAELHRDVQRFANALKDRGIGKGDVVGIFLPMVPEVAVAMLACARIGAPHNVVFGGFSPDAVRERMEFSEAKALVTIDGARRKGKTAPIKSAVDPKIEDLSSIETVFVVRHTGESCEMKEGRDLWFHDALEAADDECEPEPLDAEHPLFVLYTSGSTAKPKGVLHTTGGYLVGVAFTHRYVFDLKPESDVYWCAADVGWITGHSYIVYGPLANGATSVLFEGAPDYPDKDIWWEIVERYGVTILYTAPTAIRACLKWGPEYPAKHDLATLRLLGTVGEPINPKAWLWYWEVIGGERCPIVDTWWQTETGHILISPLPGLTEAKPGSVTKPLPGIDARWSTQTATSFTVSRGFSSSAVPGRGCSAPSIARRTASRRPTTAKFDETTYYVGDAARQDEDGYFWILGRADDVVNVAGHRLSTAEVESAVVSYPKVAECAVIGQSDEDTGQAICAFVTLEGDLEGTDEIANEIRAHVAERISKIARPKRIIWAGDLPKTRSGKIMRRLLRDIAEGREMGDVTTLRDPAVMEQLEAKVEAIRSEEA